MTRPSRPAAYFEALYAADPDPWRFASSDYERRKYQATLAALPDRAWTAAFEVGCSIGVLTRLLAPRCGRLLAIDAAERPLAQARDATRDLPQVEIACRRVPEQWPDERFDLILFSEVLYFLSPDDVARTALLARASLLPGGVVALVNWTGHRPDEPGGDPCSGDQAADLFIAAAGPLRTLTSARTPDYRLDVLAASDDAANRE